jgi:hypothetical protein
MTTVTAVIVDRSGPAIRAALAAHAPQDVARFERELREALHLAETDRDLDRVDRLIRHWHALATLAANPLTEAERAQLTRARAGDVSGLRARRDDGTWATL